MRRLTRARNAFAISKMRRIWRSSFPRAGVLSWDGPSALDLVLGEIRSAGLTGVSDGAVTANLLLLGKAYSDGGRQWVGTGRAVDVATLEELGRYARFTAAAYGTLFASLSLTGCRGSLRQFFRWLRAGSTRRHEVDAEEICRACEIDAKDLFHYDTGGRDAFSPAWFLARDPVSGAGVLSIRGTITLADILTDVAGESVPFDGGVAHRGFLRGAEAVIRGAQEPLQRLLSQGVTELVVCGHSLGAGCAVLATLALLKEQRSPPSPLEPLKIRCLTYGCPPTVARPPGSEEVPVVNVVNRFDWIPRLQLANILRLARAVGQIEALGLPLRRKVKCLLGRESPSELGIRFDDVYTVKAQRPASDVITKQCQSLDLVGETIWLYDACAGLVRRAEFAVADAISFGPPALEDPLRAMLDHVPLAYVRGLQEACKTRSATSTRAAAAAAPDGS